MLTILALVVLLAFFGFAIAGAVHFWQGSGFFSFACSLWCLNTAGDLFTAIVQLIINAIEEATT